MRVSEFFPLEEFERPKILAGTREGLAWIRRQPRMLIILSLVFVISTFCFNFNVTLPVLAKVTLNGHAYVYGLLSAAFGVGALVGALAAASLGRASMKVLLVGGLLFSARELLLAPVNSALLAGVLLFFVGAGFTAWSANSNAIMQLAAPDHLRGRVIGLYFYAFNGTGAIAGIMTGWLCDVGGTELAFVVSGLIGMVAVIGDGADARLDAAAHDAPPRRAAAARVASAERRRARRPPRASVRARRRGTARCAPGSGRTSRGMTSTPIRYPLALDPMPWHRRRYVVHCLRRRIGCQSS